MGPRILAVAVVIASACTALHYSVTTGESVVVSNNPYTFNGAGSQTFFVTPATSGDDDMLLAVRLDNCSSQWTLMPSSIDTLPTQICGSKGSGSANVLVACPHGYAFTVQFAGTQQGTNSCNVLLDTMPSAGGSNDTKALVLTGIGSAGSALSVSPTQVNFIDAQINVPSSPTVVTVKNNGSADMFIAGSLSGSAFQVTPSVTSFSLGSGSSKQFSVTCTPPAIGSQSGELSFSGSGTSNSAKLDCNGIDSTITIMPSQVNFDATLVGRPPPQETVMITAGTNATIKLIELDPVAAAAGVSIASAPPLDTTVGSGVGVVLSYDAAAVHEAGPLGALIVRVSTDQEARHIGISGQALLGGIGTNPASVEFGAVCIGDTAMKDIEVYANEAGDVELQALTPPAAPFGATTTDALPKLLGGNHAGASAAVTATLAPTSAGDVTDMLVLASDVPNQPSTEVELHGIALAAGIAATPNIVHFGTAALGTTTSIQQVQLTNCGTGDLMFTGASITGMSESEFTLVGANPPRSLAPTESMMFMVIMQPETSGLKVAQLVISHDAGTTLVDLDGTAEGDDDVAGGKDRETYYGCSAGRAGVGWPVMLLWLGAFALLVPRRRRR